MSSPRPSSEPAMLVAAFRLGYLFPEVGPCPSEGSLVIIGFAAGTGQKSGGAAHLPSPQQVLTKQRAPLGQSADVVQV
jgi:hypothetical protein